ANAAVAILRMDRPDETAKVWSMLKHSPDPTVRTYLIHRLGPLGADARDIITHLDGEKDMPIRRALILSLGEFKETQLRSLERQALIDEQLTIYKEPDAGLHAAAEWLLKAWRQDHKIKTLAQTLRMKEAQIHKHHEKDVAGDCRWHINGEGQT